MKKGLIGRLYKASPSVVVINDCVAESHNERNHTIDLLFVALLAREDVVLRVNLRNNVAHHPSEHRVTVVANTVIENKCFE